PPPAPTAPAPPGDPSPSAVLVGPALSAADVDELAELMTAFGLDPIMVPDLSGSLDGHLADDWSPLTTGGTTLADLGRLGDCDAITAVGATVAGAAAVLAERTGAEATHLAHLCGLTATDALVMHLLDRTGRPVPAAARRWRSRLADGLLDTHFVLGGARVALALEPDQLYGVTSLLRDVGAEIVTAVSPQAAPVLEQVPCDEVVIGDLNDLEERAAEAGAELVLASSHARALARRIGAAHLVLGFPVYDRLGAALRGTAGYRGSLRLLVDAANQLLDHHDHAEPRVVSRAVSEDVPKGVSRDVPENFPEDFSGDVPEVPEDVSRESMC
ncbi:MAG: nitrogenase iron-molybdenum cofactor biosynthesis protein NifN, partial [Frankia sp.]|nr:nitrogenase iron-molybdenum cofactor biosynthesis protein NifN [Frankia sp.]